MEVRLEVAYQRLQEPWVIWIKARIPVRLMKA